MKLEKLRAAVWDFAVRFRTYVVNGLFAVLFAPDIIMALLGFNWSALIPKEYMGYVLLAVSVANVWMRPRPASRARDPEVVVRNTLAEAKKGGEEAIITVAAPTSTATVTVDAKGKTDSVTTGSGR